MKEKKILIVKLNRLGDTIAFIPALEAIRKNMPDAHLTLLTTDVGREIVEGTDLADRIWVSAIKEVRMFVGFFKWLKIIRKNRFDIAVASSDSSSFIALLFFMSAIPVRVGFTNPKLSFLFTHRIPFSENITHAELNLLIAKHLGLPAGYSRPVIPVPEEDKKAVSDFLKGNGIKESDNFIVIHPGSGRLTPSQRWPLERFAGLISYLSGKYGTRIIFVGGINEKNLTSSMYKHLHREDFIDIAGKTNIKQLIYVISLAKLFIGNPSGPLQIAYLVGTPTVSLWGASSLSSWGPMRDKEKHICIRANLDCLGCEQAQCFKGTFECMNLITQDMIIKEISKIL